MDGKIGLLVIDDNRELTKVLDAYFTTRGFKVYVANTGREAMKILGEKNDIGAILLDLMLPDVSGVEILKNIRALNKTVPVIIISGSDDINNAIKTLKSGADDYVLKPFGLGEVEEKINEIMYKKAIDVEENKFLTAREAMKILDDVKEKTAILRFVFKSIDELNRFTECLKGRDGVAVKDIRIGENYEVLVEMNG